MFAAAFASHAEPAKPAGKKMVIKLKSKQPAAT
jgi:hypothetical protein